MWWSHGTIRAGRVLDDPRLVGRTVAVRCGSCAAPSRFPRSSRSVSSWPRTASIMSVWRRPRCSATLGERSTTGSPLASTTAWASRTAIRTAPPTRHARCRNASSIIVAARSYLTDDEPAIDTDTPQARVARYAWVDHYAPLRAGLRDVARSIRRADHRAVAFADDNSIVDREVAHRAGLGWFGKNANLLLPGAGSWFVLGSSSPPPSTSRPPPRRRRVRHVPAVPRRLPDRGDRRPRGDRRRRCLAWLLQKPGVDPRRVPGGDRRPDLRLRRLPGGLPADRPARPPLHRRTSTTVSRGRGSTSCELLDADDECDRAAATAAGTSPTATRAGCGATRWSCSATSADRAIRGRRAVLARYRPGPDPILRSTPTGPHGASTIAVSRGTTRPAPDPTPASTSPSRHMKHLLVTNDFPPKIGGIQSLLWEWWRRLPARPLRRAHQPVRRRRGVRRRRSRSASSARREPVLLPHPWMVRRRSTTSPREVGADLVVLDPALPLGLVGPSLAAAVRRRAARRRGHRARPAAGDQAGAGARAAAGPATSSPPAATRRPRPSGPPGASCRSPSCRPGVDAERFHPLTDAERLERAPRTSACPSTPRWCVGISPARAAEGLRRRDPGGRPAGDGHAPTCCWRSPAAGRDDDRLRAAGRRARRARAVPRAGPQRRPAARCTAAPTCSRCCAATGGAASSRRASASCSSRPRPAACRRSPATPAGRPRPWSTA